VRRRGDLFKQFKNLTFRWISKTVHSNMKKILLSFVTLLISIISYSQDMLKFDYQNIGKNHYDFISKYKDNNYSKELLKEAFIDISSITNVHYNENSISEFKNSIKEYLIYGDNGLLIIDFLLEKSGLQNTTLSKINFFNNEYQLKHKDKLSIEDINLLQNECFESFKIEKNESAKCVLALINSSLETCKNNLKNGGNGDDFLPVATVDAATFLAWEIIGWDRKDRFENSLKNAAVASLVGWWVGPRISSPKVLNDE